MKQYDNCWTYNKTVGMKRIKTIRSNRKVLEANNNKSVSSLYVIREKDGNNLNSSKDIVKKNYWLESEK